MKARALVIAVWVATLVVVCIGFVRAHGALGALPSRRSVIWPPPAIAALVDSDSIAALADRIVQSDPFRTARQPSDIAYDPTRRADTPAAPAATTIPTMTVSGIIGGPPWTALVSGVPGRDGTASVHAGDTIAGTTVISVARTSVLFRAADTSWRLTLHSPWPK